MLHTVSILLNTYKRCTNITLNINTGSIGRRPALLLSSEVCNLLYIVNRNISKLTILETNSRGLPCLESNQGFDLSQTNCYSLDCGDNLCSSSESLLFCTNMRNNSLINNVLICRTSLELFDKSTESGNKQEVCQPLMYVVFCVPLFYGPGISCRGIF